MTNLKKLQWANFSRRTNRDVAPLSHTVFSVKFEIIGYEVSSGMTSTRAQLDAGGGWGGERLIDFWVLLKTILKLCPVHDRKVQKQIPCQAVRPCMSYIREDPPPG